MQYSFSYYYYVYHRHKVYSAGSETLRLYLRAAVDTDHDGYISPNEFRTLAAILTGDAPKEEFIESIRECLSNSSASYRLRFNHSEAAHYRTAIGEVRKGFTVQLYPTVEEALNCSIVDSGLKEKVDWRGKGVPPSPVMGADKEVAFEMIGDNYTDSIRQLDSVRARQSKFICINDNMQQPSEQLERALQDFFESFFPVPSIFELEPGRRNPSLYLDEYRKATQKNQNSIWKLASKKHLRTVFQFIRRNLITIWKLIRNTILHSLLAAADILISLLDDGAEDRSQYFINGIRSDVLRKPNIPQHSIDNSAFDPTSSTTARIIVLLSVVGLTCIVILRSLSRKRTRSISQGSNSSNQGDNLTRDPVPSSPTERMAGRFVRKVAPKTPSKLEQRAATLEDDEEQDESDTSEVLRGVAPQPLHFDDASEEEEVFTEPEGYFGSLLSSVGLRQQNLKSPRSVPTSSEDEPAVAELEDDVVELSALPSKSAAPSKSGFRNIKG